MPTESFRERNRRRRQQNALEHLREYAAARGLPEPGSAAAEAAGGRSAAERKRGGPKATAGEPGAPRRGAAGGAEPGGAAPGGAAAAATASAEVASGGAPAAEAASAEAASGEAAPAETGAGEVASDQSASGGTSPDEAAAPAPTAKPAGSRPSPKPEKGEEKDEGASIPHRLEDRTKEQLYARAQELQIEGRSSMTKDELIEAIRAKQ